LKFDRRLQKFAAVMAREGAPRCIKHFVPWHPQYVRKQQFGLQSRSLEAVSLQPCLQHVERLPDGRGGGKRVEERYIATLSILILIRSKGI